MWTMPVYRGSVAVADALALLEPVSVVVLLDRPVEEDVEDLDRVS